ncbi:hypothetical protein ABT033_31075 [Streptomyces pharetrae]|uniref:hypothetical protein n=1 Tax=Streptomyces pharetrae TaxID=291370 RepID=UPI0033546E1B
MTISRTWPIVFRRHPVPFITAWSPEIVRVPPLGAGRGGLTMRGHDRDDLGMLWQPFGDAPGVGEPRHGTVHGPRQRLAMRKRLCQTCRAPADHDERGFLWLLEGRADDPDWLFEGVRTMHPPVCRRCALAAAQIPYLRKRAVAIRVQQPEVDCVYGQPHHRSWGGPVPGAPRTVSLQQPEARWMLGAQLVVSLHGCTPVSLDELLTLTA